MLLNTMECIVQYNALLKNMQFGALQNLGELSVEDSLLLEESPTICAISAEEATKRTK